LAKGDVLGFVVVVGFEEGNVGVPAWALATGNVAAAGDDVVPLQTPFWHPWPKLQTVPHAPQFILSFDRVVHPATHLVWPCGHAHWPPTHVAPPVQTLLQEPQFQLSVCASMQLLLQYVLSAEHFDTHWPAWQVSLIAHWTSQELQCMSSDCRSTH
jgi:hypothetical protein